MTINTQENKRKFIELWNEHVGQREGAKEFLEWLEYSTDFFTAPASTRHHLAQDGGLCQHTLNVMEGMVERKLENMESAVLVAAVHDVCKTNIYVPSFRNVKVYSEKGSKQDAGGRFDWETVKSYEIKDELPLGHSEKSIYLTSKYIRLTDEEAMAINAHMGGFDARAKDGFSISQCYEKTPLAVYLMISDMEATFIKEKESV